MVPDGLMQVNRRWPAGGSLARTGIAGDWYCDNAKQGRFHVLRLRRIGIDTYQENVALIRRCCQAFRPEEHQALRKVEIGYDHKAILIATLAIVDDDSLLEPEELGLSEQAFRRLGLTEGTVVTIAPASPPRSLDAVRSKIHGRTLSANDVRGIIQDVTAHRYSEMEIAAFLANADARRIEAVAVHALFDRNDAKAMAEAGVSRIRSTDSVAHPTNAIALAPLLAAALANEMP
jgi:phosphoribosylpyrophosphate synthetase